MPWVVASRLFNFGRSRMPLGHVGQIRRQGGVGGKRDCLPQVRLSGHIALRVSKQPPKLLVLHKVGSMGIRLEASAPGWILSITGNYSLGRRSLLSRFVSLARKPKLASPLTSARRASRAQGRALGKINVPQGGLFCPADWT